MAEAVLVRLHRRPANLVWPAAACVAVLVAGAPVAAAVHAADLSGIAGDLAVAVAFTTCGAALWAGRRGGLSGPLMVATGVAWVLGDVVDGLALLHRGPLIQLLAAAPDGRPRTWPQRVVVVGGYVDAFAAGVGRTDAITLVLAAALMVLAVGRVAHSRVAQRRSLVVPTVAAVAVALALVLAAMAEAADGETVLWTYEGVLTITAVMLYADLQRASARSTVTRMVIELGDAPSGGVLTAAIAGAVGDPSLAVGYPLGDGSVVDERGHLLELPAGEDDRVVTRLGAGDKLAAVLVHERSALGAPGVAEAIVPAVRLALDRVRLQAEIRARIRDVDVSRARLLDARDAERRDLEARLRAAVDPTLQRAADLLAGLEDHDEPLVSALPLELESARTELRRFAAGLHPRDLDTGGLQAALLALAAGAPIPVEVDVRCGRLAPAIESAAWFTCAEALTNVVKHAAATQATVRAEQLDDWLLVVVRDDGCGGAEPADGRGLLGLAARVEAVGGRLDIDNPPEGGCTVKAWLPARGQR